MKIITLLMLFLTTRDVSGHTFATAVCPNVSAMENFNVNRFLGRWYIIETYGARNPCMTFTFENKSDAELTVTQQREFIFLKTLGITYKNDYRGTLTFVDLENPSDMIVRWPLNLLRFISPVHFKVVDTDYDTHALIMECQNILMFSRRSATILSRQKELDGEKMSILHQRISSSGFDTSQLTKVNHGVCTIDTGSTDTATDNNNNNVSVDNVETIEDNLLALMDDNTITKLENMEKHFGLGV